MIQVIFVLNNLSKGKTAVQVAHASVSAFVDAHEIAQNAWIRNGQKKIVLKVEDVEDLLILQDQHKGNLIRDKNMNKYTALGIGPIQEGLINLSEFELLK